MDELPITKLVMFGLRTVRVVEGTDQAGRLAFFVAENNATIKGPIVPDDAVAIAAGLAPGSQAYKQALADTVIVMVPLLLGGDG